MCFSIGDGSIRHSNPKPTQCRGNRPTPSTWAAATYSWTRPLTPARGVLQVQGRKRRARSGVRAQPPLHRRAPPQEVHHSLAHGHQHRAGQGDVPDRGGGAGGREDECGASGDRLPERWRQERDI